VNVLLPDLQVAGTDGPDAPIMNQSHTRRRECLHSPPTLVGGGTSRYFPLQGRSKRCAIFRWRL